MAPTLKTSQDDPIALSRVLEISGALCTEGFNRFYFYLFLPQ